MKIRSFASAAFVSVALAYGCASSPRAASGDGCTLAAADSVYLSGGPIFRDCAVDQPAKATATPVDFRPGPEAASMVGQRGVACHTAEVQFVVDREGRPEPDTERIVRSNNTALSDALLANLRSWRYTPALIEGVPVRQIVRERKAIALAVAVVPAGQARPARPQAPPACR